MIPDDFSLCFLLITIRTEVSASAAAEFSNEPAYQDFNPKSSSKEMTVSADSSLLPVTKTSAFMENKNLLLSDDASISSKPILEIYNDDTECSHSATSGSIDKEKLFYLKTRGIDEVEAKSFLINSFIEEISGEIRNKKIQDALWIKR